MDCRLMTPPTAITIHDYDNMQCPGGSASTTATSTYLNPGWSPETISTATTTPPRSPPKFDKDAPGSWLLPKPRDQDRLAGQVGRISSYNASGHVRTVSCPSNMIQYPLQLDHVPLQTVEDFRRSATPPEYVWYPAVQLSQEVQSIEPIAPAKPRIEDIRPPSAKNVRSHSRTGSSSSLDMATIFRHGYPYHSSPGPQPMGRAQTRMPTAMNFLAPVTMPGGQIQSYPKTRRIASPAVKGPRLLLQTQLPEDREIPTTTLLEYLQKPNPIPSLVKRQAEGLHGLNAHCWFDVRNVKPWEDFNVDTISKIPQLLDLLRCAIPESNLPKPVRSNQTPETLAQLADICAQHHAVKVNAALKVCQGADKHITIRTLKAAPVGKQQQPEFVANYQSEGEKTIFGNGNGRVVGIVKSFEQWSSSKQSGSANDKVDFLRGLAQLHHFMREHGTRYGFIMTEIELVCVRAGGVPSEDNVPLFGYLEVAPAVQVSAAGIEGGGVLKMTVGLALWFLHMMAKEQPFPEQYHWKMEVGAPTALSRRKHLAQDLNLPKPSVSEKRDAKRARGWVWPEEPLSRQEKGRKSRARAK